MPSRMVHIYMPEEDADAVRKAAEQLSVSETALYRGALKELTKGFTDFSGARDWVDYRPRGRKRGDGETTGSEVNDASWALFRHSAPADLVNKMDKALKLVERGATMEEALNEAFPQLFDDEARQQFNDDELESLTSIDTTRDQRPAEGPEPGEEEVSDV